MFAFLTDKSSNILRFMEDIHSQIDRSRVDFCLRFSPVWKKGDGKMCLN